MGFSMDRDRLLVALTQALQSIRNPDYFSDERGFQGELYAELRQRLSDIEVARGATLRQEYQKKLEQHGLTIRPDIILHEPFDPNVHRGRNEGNHVVIELKRRASRATAYKAMSSLISMIDVLNYPLGILINVDDNRVWAELVPERYRDRIVCFAVHQPDKAAPPVVIVA